MKVFKNLAELEAVGLSSIAAVMRLIMDEDADALFMEAVGGDVFLLETLEELRDILYKFNPPLIVTPAHEWEESTLHQLDVVFEIDEAKDYWGFVTINNNSGGPTYFVPVQVLNTWTELRDVIAAYFSRVKGAADAGNP